MSNSRGKDRAAYKAAPKKRFTAASVIVAVVLLLFIAALLINSDFMRRQATAVETNGMNFSAAEYRFFYVNTINEYTNYINQSFGDYASSFLPDSSKPFESQINSATGQTWAEYYEQMALDNMMFFAGAYREAIANGFEMPEEESDLVDTNIATLIEQVSTYYAWTFKEYIDYQFGSGSGITEQLYRELSHKQHYVRMYSQDVRASFNYAESAIDDYYVEHKDEFDYYKYRYFSVKADALNEEDFETTEDYEAADKAAVDEARALAEEYISIISNEQDFIEKAREYNPEAYANDASTLYHVAGADLTVTFGDWLKDSSRKSGDMRVEPASDNESTNRTFYVAYYLDRIDNEYPTVNVNLMVVSGEALSSSDYTDDKGNESEIMYNNALEDAAAKLEAKATELFEEWSANGSTQEYLTEYYEKNTAFTYGSLDEYSGSISGAVYKNVSYSFVADDLPNEWMHDKSRKEGDTAAIRYDDTTWYLLYFIGHDMYYSDYLADSALRTEDFTKWEESFTTDVTLRWGMKLL